MELLWPWSGEGKRTGLLSSNTGSASRPAYTALGALVWSKSHKDFLGEGREGAGKILPHELTSGTGPVISEHELTQHGDEKRQMRQAVPGPTDPCLYSKFSATV